MIATGVSVMNEKVFHNQQVLLNMQSTFIYTSGQLGNRNLNKKCNLSCKVTCIERQRSNMDLVFVVLLLQDLIRSLMFSTFLAGIGVGSAPLRNQFLLINCLFYWKPHSNNTRPVPNVTPSSQLLHFSALFRGRLSRLADEDLAAVTEAGQLLWPLGAQSGQCGGFSFRSAGRPWAQEQITL